MRVLTVEVPLEQRQGVAEDHAVFVLLVLPRDVVAPHGVFPHHTKAFQRTCRHNIGQGQVALPLAGAGGRSIDIVTFKDRKSVV